MNGLDDYLEREHPQIAAMMALEHYIKAESVTMRRVGHEWRVYSANGKPLATLILPGEAK